MVIAGGGGHALEVLDELKRLLPNEPTQKLICFDQDDSKLKFEKEIRVVHSESALLESIGSSFSFCLGVGSPHFRRKLFDLLKSIGGSYFPLKSTNSFIGESSVGDFDTMTKTFIGPRVVIGLGSLVNVGANIHHECTFGEFVEIGPGSLILGKASIGDNSQLGAGVVVLPGVSIGKNCVIGAGSVVTRDIEDGATAFGVPCKVKNC